MDQILVGMGDCKISDRGSVLATYALGSCVGLALYDASARVGGLLHFMLPDSAIEGGPISNPYKYADTGIPCLIEGMRARGAQPRRMLARAAGGASMVGGRDLFEIGKRNYLALRRILWKSGILLHAEAMGGRNFRSLKLEVASGRLWVQEGGSIREFPRPLTRLKGDSDWHTGS